MIPLPPDLRRRPLWLHRPVLNWQDIYRWAIDAGAVELLPYKSLHVTVATCRSRIDWNLIGGTDDREIVVEVGEKPMGRLGQHAHVMRFEQSVIADRFRQIAGVMPVDYPDAWSGHVTLGRGPTFRQPSHPYDGALVLGGEIAEPFIAGVDFARIIPINRNKYRELIGLPPHDDEAAKAVEFHSRVKPRLNVKKKIASRRLQAE